MTSRELIAFLMLLIVPFFSFLAWRSVRRRKAVQEKVLAEPQLADQITGAECIYVATVFYENPLDKVWAHGLGTRGNAEIAIQDGRVHIQRTGERSLSFTPIDVQLRSATIDKGVERDGLVELSWELEGQPLATLIRFRSPASQANFLSQYKSEIGAN